MRATATGLLILNEWFGEGGQPVPRPWAAVRASICEVCPENGNLRWWDYAKESVAIAIKWHLAVKNQISLHLPQEGKLGMCRVCHCCLPLKVWAPIGVLAKHLKDEQKKKFPSHCWIKHELSA